METYTRRQCKLGGRNAHQVQDYAIDPSWFEQGVLYPGAPIYVRTPRGGWHLATLRERALLKQRGLRIWVDWPPALASA